MTGMNGMSAVTDDPGELQARLAEATSRLLGTAAGLTDSQAREPSLLPGSGTRRQDLGARLAAAGLADRPQLGRRPDRRPGWAAARGARVVVIQQTARIQQTAAFSAPPRRRGPGQRHGR